MADVTHVDKNTQRKRTRDPLNPLYDETQAYFRLCIPQQERSDELAQLRAQEIKKRREQYNLKFDIFGAPGYAPPYPTTIPDDEKEGLWHIIELLNKSVATAGTLVKNELRETFFYSLYSDGEDPWQRWYRFYEGLDLPDVAKRWRNDDDFARQRICGLSPKLIRRLTDVSHLPDYFPVTDAHFQSGLPKHMKISFADAVKAGKVYWIDYVPTLENIGSPPERCLQVPCCLFVVDDSKEPGSALTPVLIQLQPNYAKRERSRRAAAAAASSSSSSASPAAPATATSAAAPTTPYKSEDYVEPPMFTPHDSANTWLAAKIHVQVADAQVHGVREHLMHTHLCGETFYTIARRNLSTRHPVHELLYPHFYFTLVLNWAARHFLIANNPINVLPQIMAMGFDGQNEILRRGWSDFNFGKLHPKTDIKERGCETLPGYWFRDDAYKLYDVTHKYVLDMLNIFYPTDKDCLDDVEVQNFIRELGSPTGGNFRGLNVAGPRVTKAELVEIIATMIFNVTGGHSAVNNTQWDFIGYIPNIPSSFRYDGPKAKDELITDRQICDSMPGFADNVRQLLMFSGLSTPTSQPLGQFAATYFETMKETRKVINEFKAELARLDNEIVQRNTMLKVPYPYLRPTLTSASIAT